MSEPLAPGDLERTLKTRGRGYDREDVDAHLARISESYNRLWGERNELRSELARFQEDEHILGETLVTAQRTAERVVAGAKREAKKLVESARRDAEAAVEETKHEQELQAAEIERLGSLRREAEATLREFVSALVEVIEQQETDLESALAVAEPVTAERAEVHVGEQSE
jgi:cell division initiation protein